MSLLPPKDNYLVKHMGTLNPLIGVVHCMALPGSPGYGGEPLSDIVAHAVEEAGAYYTGGFDAVIIENAGDVPFQHPRDIGPETVAAMTLITHDIRCEFDIPIGVSLLSNALVPAIAVAHAAEAHFIRAHQWVNAFIANEGFIEGPAARALRYRRNIGSDVAVFADVQVKHGSHAIVGDRSIEEQARDVEFFGADALIVTGQRTSDATDVSHIATVREATGLPVLAGSGVDTETVGTIFGAGAGAILATSVKYDGIPWNRVDVERVRAVVLSAKKSLDNASTRTPNA